MEYDISDIDEKLFLNKYLNSDVKQFLLDNKKINLDSYTADELYELIVNDNVIIYSDDITDKILESNLKQEYKIKYLSKIKDNITSKKILFYFSTFDGEYKYIGVKFNVADVKYNEDLIPLLEKLKLDNIISSYKEGKNKNMLIYNKKSNI